MIVGSNYVINVHLDGQDNSQQDLAEKLRYDPLGEVVENPEYYTGEKVRVKGELTNYTGQNRISEHAMDSEAGKLQIKSCNLDRTRDSILDVEGEIDSYRTCNCIYKDPTYGWDESTQRQATVSSCVNSTPPLYVDSRCNGNTKTHYYLKCTATFEP